MSRLGGQEAQVETLRNFKNKKKVYAFDLPFLIITAALVSSSNQIVVGLATISSLLQFTFEKTSFPRGRTNCVADVFSLLIRKKKCFHGHVSTTSFSPFNPSNTLYMPGPGGLGSISENSTKIVFLFCLLVFGSHGPPGGPCVQTQFFLCFLFTQIYTSIFTVKKKRKKKVTLQIDGKINKLILTCR